MDKNKITTARNRPKLVITYYNRPSAGELTSTKGWSATGKFDVKEEALIVSRLKPKHEIQAHVIIDILQARVLKNRFEDQANDTVYQHYIEKYSTDIQTALTKWLKANFQEEVDKLYAEEKVEEVLPVEDVLQTEEIIG